MNAIVLYTADGELALRGDLIDIGRDRDCAVVVDADGVAPRHCRLIWSNGQWVLEYLGPGVAVAVIGREQSAEMVLARRTLEPDDRIVIGHHATPLWSATVAGPEGRRAAPAPAPTPRPAPAPAPDERALLRETVERMRGALARERQSREAAELALVASDERHRQDLTQLRHRLEGELADAELLIKSLRGQLAALGTSHAVERDRRREADRERDDVRRQFEAARAEIKKLIATAQEQADLAEQLAQVIDEQERQIAASHGD